ESPSIALCGRHVDGRHVAAEKVADTLTEDHGEASQVNIAESRSVNDELRILESQIKLKEVGIRQAEAEAIEKRESFAKDPDVGTFRPFLSQGTVEVDGIANVACVHKLPVAGVNLILGNDLAGGQMGNVTPPPVLRERPESTAELQQLEDDMPGLFPLCAVTHDSLSLEGLFANQIASQDVSSAVNAVTWKVALIAAQEQDDSLRLLFDSANDSGPTTRYF
ncbi:hypothetical protein Hamer_G014923, partial [Homarus americanus]